MSVIFRHRVRSEQKFSSLDELTQQIGKDTQQARAWLANH